MKIDVVSLIIKKEYEKEIDITEKYFYGVETAGKVFQEMIGSLNVENVGLICLDNTNKIINYSNVAIGNVDGVRVAISQIFKIALVSNSSKIIIAHNHPSGVLEVTSYDIDLTKKIGSLAKCLDIELIDSLVVNEKESVSIREKIGERLNEK